MKVTEGSRGDDVWDDVLEAGLDSNEMVRVLMHEVVLTGVNVVALCAVVLLIVGLVKYGRSSGKISTRDGCHAR